MLKMPVQDSPTAHKEAKDEVPIMRWFILLFDQSLLNLH